MLQNLQHPQQSLPQQKQLFALTQKKRYQLQHQIPKIFTFCPMSKKTAIIFGIKAHRKQAMMLINQQGRILKQKQYENLDLYAHCIPNNQEIVWIDPELDLIYQWNVQTDQYLEFQFCYMSKDQGSNQELFYFARSRLLCVAQWGRFDSNSFKLTYFGYPLRQNSQPVHEFYSEQVWNYDYLIKKGNQNSMILWYKSNQVQQFQFRTYELLQQILQNGNKKQDQPKWIGNYKQHSTPNIIKEEQKSYELSIGTIWQMIPNKYMFIGLIHKPIVDNKFNNCIFVYQQLTNKSNNNTHTNIKKVLRYARFAFYQKFQVQISDYIQFGNTVMIKTFDFKDNKALQSPIYYIDNITQSIIAKSSWRCAHHNKYVIPGYDTNLLLDLVYENANVKEVVCNSVKIVSERVVSADLVDLLVEDVEKDLVREVVRLLYGESTN